jgi:hypothetical protein
MGSTTTWATSWTREVLPLPIAIAYDHAALERFGEFAQTNFTYEEGGQPSLREGHRLDLPYSLAT